jgi:hypothetical protein
MSPAADRNTEYIFIMRTVYAKSMVDVVFIDFPVTRLEFLAANRRRSVKHGAECHFVYAPAFLKIDAVPATLVHYATP